ncbi:MAG: hypothetical protein Q9170_003032 [Blastenia crenularia]
MSNSLESAPQTPVDTLDEQSPTLFSDSAAYANHQVTEDLHPAFADTGIKFDREHDCFAPEVEDTSDELVLSASQKAFTDALEQFQEGVKPKYRSRIILREQHTWDEVIDSANQARTKYTGVGKRGIMKKIDHGLKTFQTAAPAIEAWLKLLPSTSTYGSVVCGGLTILLEAAIRLRQLRKETLNALDQIPLCIEKAEFFMRTYGYSHVNQQVGNLYLAIVDELQHILEWYKRAAGMKYLSSAVRGPAYAELLKKKMKNVETASQAMSERADERKQVRLKEIRDVSMYTKDQVGELKILAVEARNHLYAVLKDTEAWQEALQSNCSLLAATHVLEEENTAARRSLLARFGPNYDDPSRDMESVLNHVTSMTLGDQDRVGAFIELQSVEEWLLNPIFGGLLVHGNGRRHDPISPTAVACSLLVHVLSKKLHFPTLYWFCGLHNSGPHGNPLGMLRSLICQLLCLSCCRCSPDDRNSLDTKDVKKLLRFFQRLLRRSATTLPIVCILDGLSFYESTHQSDVIGKIVSTLVTVAKSDPPVLILLLTSPIRTRYLCRQPEIAQSVTITELPDYVSGAKQGLDSRKIMSKTEIRARKLSETLRSR